MATVHFISVMSLKLRVDKVEGQGYKQHDKLAWNFIIE